MNWSMLEIPAAIATLAVVAFYLRRQAHYNDALEREIGELRRQIEREQRATLQRHDGLRASLDRLMASQQEILKLREDVPHIESRSVMQRLEELESAHRAAVENLGRRIERQQQDPQAATQLKHQPPRDRPNPPKTAVVATETNGTAPLHPVFGRFRRYQGPGRKGFAGFDFLCSFVHEDYAGGKASYVPWLATDYPAADEDLFAWIDLLEAVVGARHQFRMFELGAGYGCWAARGALAAMQLGLDVALTCIEPEPQHFQWMEQHMLANSIPVSSVRMIHAALAGKPGRLPFWVDSPYPEHRNARHWYGQAVVQPGDVVLGSSGDYHGLPLLAMKSGYKAVEVPVITLNEALNSEDVVDFIHADLQNAELDVFSAGMDLVDRQVKRVNIGTHSIASEEGLRDLFHTRGWECLADYSLGAAHETPYGMIEFQDGVQSWRNPKLASR